MTSRKGLDLSYLIINFGTIVGGNFVEHALRHSFRSKKTCVWIFDPSTRMRMHRDATSLDADDFGFVVRIGIIVQRSFTRSIIVIRIVRGRSGRSQPGARHGWFGPGWESHGRNAFASRTCPRVFWCVWSKRWERRQVETFQHRAKLCATSFLKEKLANIKIEDNKGFCFVYILLQKLGLRTNYVFSVCSFTHLLYVHIVFEQNFVFPLFLYLLTCSVSLHPFTEIPVLND